MALEQPCLSLLRRKLRSCAAKKIIYARHDAAKPQNTVDAERSAAKLWNVGDEQPLLPGFIGPLIFSRPCHSHISALAEILQWAFPDGDLMSQANILELSL